MSIYQDLEAKYDTEETPESIILRVHLPDGSFGLLILMVPLFDLLNLSIIDFSVKLII